MESLSGIRVIDFSRLLPGPFCTMMLGDMGADIVKVEPLRTGDPTRWLPPFRDGESIPFVLLNRNKRSLAVNYRDKEGLDLLRPLLRSADVLVETFKPGQAQRIGLDYERVIAINPNLIYCSLSGYGQQGSLSPRSGHDINFMALAGMLDLLRDRDGRPVLPGFQPADIVGGLFAVTAILAALVERGQTQAGRFLDISLMQASRILLFLPLAEMLLGNTAQRRASDYLGGHFPCYDVYETSDSQYMALGALEPFIWSAFCSAIGKEHLVALQFSNNTEELERVREELKQLFKARSRHEWETFFADRDLCCEPVRSLKEVSQSLPAESGDRGPAANEPSHHELFAGMMFSTLGNDLYSRKGAPHMGQHTEEILRELGFSSQEIGSLKSRKLIGTMDEKPVRRYGSIVSG